MWILATWLVGQAARLLTPVSAAIAQSATVTNMRIVLVAMGLAVLAACSSAEDSSADSVAPPESVDSVAPPESVDSVAPPEPVVAIDPVDSAGYTIVAGDTLSAIAARAGVSLSDLVDANGWPDGSDHLILPGDVIALPQGASAPGSAAAPLDATAPAGGSDPAGELGGYQARPSFASLPVNQETNPIVDPLPDGEYWSVDYTSDGQDVSFRLLQLFTGEACYERFDDCLSDANTLSEPSATVSLSASAATSVIWTPGNLVESYRVSNREFARLVAGFAPASDAPAGFAYGRFIVVVTVRDGQAVAADQVFQS
jgi:LysM repeat protein